MGDAGEGLIDAESRIQERMEELETERKTRLGKEGRDPGPLGELESLKLARIELERQFAATSHERRKAVLTDAMREVDRRLAEMTVALS